MPWEYKENYTASTDLPCAVLPVRLHRHFQLPVLFQLYLRNARVQVENEDGWGLTVSRCLPCLKSLIPDNRLSIHSSPPHWAITPAILYTSSSSSSSSGERWGDNLFNTLILKFEVLKWHIFGFSSILFLTRVKVHLNRYYVGQV